LGSIIKWDKFKEELKRCSNRDIENIHIDPFKILQEYLSCKDKEAPDTHT